MKIISQDIKTTKNLNNCFISIPITNTTTNQAYECLDSEEDDPLLKTIEKYQNHPISS